MRGSTAVLSVEGVNGINSNADMSALAMEIADDLRVPLVLHTGFDSIAFSAMNGGVHAPHTAFHEKAIPCVSVAIPGENLLANANFLGKYVRAMASLYHQLHHSSSVFVYMGPRSDVHLGILFPVIVGLTSPLYPAVLLPRNNNEPNGIYVGVLAFVLSAVLLIGGGFFLALINSAPSTDCKSIVDSFRVPNTVWVLVGTLSVAHVIGSKVVAKHLRLEGFFLSLKTSAQIIYCVILTMLFVIHWSGAVLATAFVVPLLTAARPIRSNNRRSVVLAVLTLGIATTAFFALFTGMDLGSEVRESFAYALLGLRDILRNLRIGIPMPVEFLNFIHRLTTGAVSYRKDVATLIQETVCMGGFALPIIVVVIYPALVITLEILIAEPSDSGEHDDSAPGTASPVASNVIRKKGKLIAIAIAVLALAISHYITQ
jgi:hypothetical protein